ncbi:hypothetical protein CCH79_00000899, partial [Gambusia affinis]
MGFSGFGKKARTFDLDAIFEQTRRTAIERSQRILENRQKGAQVEEEGESSKSVKPSVPSQRDKAAARNQRSSDSSDSDSELVGPPVPPQHGAQEDELVGPPLPPGYRDNAANSDDDDDDSEADTNDDDDDDDDDNPVKKIPDTHEIILQHGTKTVSALGLDPSGARLVTGGYDYDVRFWDFAGMDQALQAFRTLQPCEWYGHTAMLNCGCWHPKIKEEFMTCSNDGTVRTWDVNSEKNHKSVFKPRSQQGKKVIPTCCTYSRDGKLIAAGCQDGTIQIWDRNMSVHTKFHCRQAHTPGSDTSCLCFSYDGMTLASRGGDDTLKIWDIRNFRKPVNEANRLTNYFSMQVISSFIDCLTDCCFSPDDRLVVTGTSVKKEEGNGKLVFFDRASFQKVYEIEVTNASVVRCLWHPKLNQIMVGTGNGLTKVYYDPVKSHRGAKLCVVKSKRKEKHAETLTQDYIITPHALPMFREARQRSTRKQLEKDRLDPKKSHKPEPPVSGPGRGGRVAAHGGTLSSFIVKNIALDKTDDSNPREAILRHAKEASENPYWIAPAYEQ